MPAKLFRNVNEEPFKTVAYGKKGRPNKKARQRKARALAELRKRQAAMWSEAGKARSSRLLTQVEETTEKSARSL